MEFKPYTNIDVILDIDLRNELTRLLDFEAKGEYVVLRKFDKTKLSQYWNELTQEAVGGPKYEYTDHIVLCRISGPMGRTFSTPGLDEYLTELGLVPTNTVRFYFQHNVSIDSEDIIYEIEYQGRGIPVIDPPHKKKWNILTVTPMREQFNGRIEFYMIYAQEEKK